MNANDDPERFADAGGEAIPASAGSSRPTRRARLAAKPVDTFLNVNTTEDVALAEHRAATPEMNKA